MGLARLSVWREEKQESGAISAVIFIVAIFVSVYLFSIMPTTLTDWHFFYEAPISDPYSRDGFLNPFWIKWTLVPLDVFPFRVAFAVFLVLTCGFVICVFGDNKGLIFASLASPYFLHVMVNGQVDPIVLFGYWLLKQDSPLGIPFMLAKPQVMIGSCVNWFVFTGKTNKIISTAVMLFLIGIGFALYGNWIGAMLGNISTDLHQPVNIALRIPAVGVVLFIVGMWRKNIFVSGLATLFITPYVAMHSLWVYWTAWLMENPRKEFIVLLSILNWIVAIVFT